MAVKWYAGDRLTGLSTDTKPTTVSADSVFYETNTKTNFDFTGGSWVERSVGLSTTDNVTINSITAPLSTWLNHGMAVPDVPTNLTSTADGTTTATLNYTLSSSDGVSSSAVQKSVQTTNTTTVSQTTQNGDGELFNDVEIVAQKFTTGSSKIGTVVSSVEFYLKSNTSTIGSTNLECFVGSGNQNTAVAYGTLSATNITTSFAWYKFTPSVAGTERTLVADDRIMIRWADGSTTSDALRMGSDASASNQIANETGQYSADDGASFADRSFDYCYKINTDVVTGGAYSSAGSSTSNSTFQVTGLTTDVDYKFKITPTNFIGTGSSATTSSSINTWKIPTDIVVAPAGINYPMTTDPRTNTYNVNTSYSTITHANSTLQINATSGSGDSGGSVTYIDLGSALSTKWVMRFRTKQSAYTNYLANSHHLVGLSSVEPTTTNSISSTNWVGTRWYYGAQWGESANKQGVEPRIGQNTSSGNHNNSTGVDRLYSRPNSITNTTTSYYHEYIWNVDTFTYNLYDNANYTGTPLATATLDSSTNTQWVTGTPSSVTGLRYLVYYIGNDHQLGTFTSQLDDIEIYDGVAVVPTDQVETESVGTTAIKLTYTASTSETPTAVTPLTYTIERSDNGSSGWTSYTGVTTTEYTDSNMTTDIPQYYRVKAVNSAGSSAYTSIVNHTVTSFSSPQFIADGTSSRTFGDPIMRSSPTTGGQYISKTAMRGITITTVKLWLDKIGTGGNATITCRINGTTLGTIHTNDINGGGTYSPTEVTFTGSGVTTPNSNFEIDFVMSGYSGSPPSDYVRFGHKTGDVFTEGYATQSGGQTGTGKDLCMRIYFT